MPPTPIMRRVAWRFACVVMRRVTLSVITANMQVVTDDGYHGTVIDGSVNGIHSHTSQNHHRKPP